MCPLEAAARYDVTSAQWMSVGHERPGNESITRGFATTTRAVSNRLTAKTPSECGLEWNSTLTSASCDFCYG
jgi:hypothetical protein